MTTLDRRALNRATLARQLLLERSTVDPVSAVTHLVGLQAQTPHTWYVGLWSRLAGFDPDRVGALLVERKLVRLPVMRSTVHLLTDDDALALRPVCQAPIERSTLGQFGRRLIGVDRSVLVSAAAELVAERPLMASELGRLLGERFPGSDPLALGQAARMWLPMVQVPPRGVWGRSGQARQAGLESWLGRSGSPIGVDLLVTRYLAAFGPASVRDAQVWSGLTRLGEVFARLPLREFAGPSGPLYDLPDAPRPGPDVLAPVRFLYDYDNLLLSHADRSRVMEGVSYAEHGYTADSNRQPASVLVDGVVAATWTVTHAAGAAVLAVRGFRRFSAGERSAIEAEGAGLVKFLHPKASVDVRIG